MQIVTLLTDFGLADSYVAQMKAVIYNLARHCTIVDLTHFIPPQNVLAGATALREAALLFPVGTIHVAVVDPGVGTQRRLMAARLEDHYFVMPDNGLLTRLLEKYALQAAVELTESRFWRSSISSTFHGRDIMAPVAAHMANGTQLSEFGAPLNSLVQLSLPRPLQTAAGIEGMVVAIDHFGNAITDIPRSMLAGQINDGALLISLHQVKSLWDMWTTYGQATPGTRLVLIGSQGYLELAVNCGSAAVDARIQVGDRISIGSAKYFSNG